MGHDHRRAANHEAVESLLHELLVLRIEGRRRLVEQKDLRVLEHGAGNRDTLPLAAGEHDAALANLGLVRVGDAHDEVVGIGHLGGALHVGHRGALRAVHDVLLDGHGKQHRLLGNEADLHTEPLRVIGLDVDAVDQNAALVHVIEARDEGNGSGLAGARGTDDSHGLARHHITADTVENLGIRAGRVMEVDVVEGDAALDAMRRNDTTIIVNTRDTIEKLEHAHRGSDGLHKLREDGQQRLEGENSLEGKKHVADQVASCDDASEDHLSSVP
mmetsp:Transcript_54753/g.114460  ORF Transcript_54753/g.114460 Transcript_54753/m.114460 type:complete len:273 (-) Transcript_54753:1005-1823(-)